MGSSNERYVAKLRVFMGFARELAGLSTCRRAHVGCVIVPTSLTEVLSVGYNGPPRGTPNDSCTDQVGTCGCIHGEANALTRLKSERSGLVLITTTSPCRACAGLIVNSGSIRWVIYGEQYRDTSAELVLENGSTFSATIPQLEEAPDLCNLLRHS